MAKKHRQEKAKKWELVKRAFPQSGLVVGQVLFCNGENQTFPRPTLNISKLCCFYCGAIMDNPESQVLHMTIHRQFDVCTCCFQVRENRRLLPHNLTVPSTLSESLGSPTAAEYDGESGGSSNGTGGDDEADGAEALMA